MTALVVVALLGVIAWMTRALWTKGARRAFEDQAEHPKQPDHMPDDEASRMAVHEIGHAVAAWSCTLVDCVERVTISPLGGSVVYQLRCTDDDGQRWCALVISLAGPAAEAMVYRRWKSKPARYDLRHARKLAAELVERGSLMPPWQAPTQKVRVPFDRAFSDGVSPQQVAIMSQGYSEARRVVRAHGSSYYRLVAKLLRSLRLGTDDLAVHLPKRSLWQRIASGRGRFIV